MLEDEAWALWSALKFAADVCMLHEQYLLNTLNLTVKSSLSNQTFHLGFVRKQVNVVAHNLAKVTTSHTCLHCYHSIVFCTAELIFSKSY